MNMVRMKGCARLLGFVSVVAIGLLSSQIANAGFVIDAQTWHGQTTPPKGVIFVSDNNSNLKVTDLAGITGTPANQLDLLIKMNAGSKAPDSSSVLDGSLSLEIFGKGEYNDFTLVNQDFFPVMDLMSPLYLVVKNGRHDPNQYIIDLLKFTSNGSVWDGMATIMGSNFWSGRGGEISNVALWGSVAGDDLSGAGDFPDFDDDLGGASVVPEPTTVALYAFGLFCFACGPMRRRLRKVAVVGQVA